MAILLTQVVPTIHERVLKLYKDGARRIALKGSRRGGKSVYLMQREMMNVVQFGADVNVATQTSEQGRLGMYADVCDIVDGTPRLDEVVKILQSPREIRCGYNGGVMHFSVYPNPERAKGVACDDVVINEANNFTLKQVQDIIPNARDCVFFDYNQSPTWRDKVIPDEAVVHCFWADNPFLTEAQREYFETLKRNAMSPDATAMDIWLYRVYYLGEDAEVEGEIFTPANIQRTDILPPLQHVCIYCDPAALLGSDYFACVLSGVNADKLYIADVFSPNTGAREDIIMQIEEWAKQWKVEKVIIETNGYIGGEFYRYAKKSLAGLNVASYTNTLNKFERITANFENITQRVVFKNTPNMPDYLAQVYTFAKDCEHDDNIDAIDSSFRAHRWLRHIT